MQLRCLEGRRWSSLGLRRSVAVSLCDSLSRQHRHRSTTQRSSSSFTSESASPPSLSTAPSHTQLLSTSAYDGNLSRLRELLQELGPQHASALFSRHARTQRREVWPQRVSASHGARASPCFASAAITQPGRDAAAKVDEHQKATHDPVRWYGSPPGVVREVRYFTAAGAARLHDYFHSEYTLVGKPAAPLLRCPACAAHLLSRSADGGVASLRDYIRAPASSRLWMDPDVLDRHLSWAHPDQLYTALELQPYNAQVLRELMYSCGLLPLSQCGVDAPDSGWDVSEWKRQPAKLIVSVDVANMEIGATHMLQEWLTSPDLRRIFKRTPVAVCATQELFVPFTAKILHVFHQLVCLNPASTMHIFAANTAVESGDVAMASFVNEMLLASPTRAIPPVILLTRDGQQRQVARDMHGCAQETLSPVGVVRGASASSVAGLAQEMRSALTSSAWRV